MQNVMVDLVKEALSDQNLSELSEVLHFHGVRQSAEGPQDVDIAVRYFGDNARAKVIATTPDGRRVEVEGDTIEEAIYQDGRRWLGRLDDAQEVATS